MMKQIKHYIIALAIVFLGLPVQVIAQDSQTKQLTKEQVLSMSMEELSALPLEELMQAIDVAGVTSMEELFDLILNKNIKSASKKLENAFDSPLSTTVLTRSEMETYGATSFEEALRLVPGVIVREKTNGNFDVHIRGLDNLPPKNMLLYSENQNTLVMIDGRPVFNYVFGGTLWETLPIGFEDVDRIEVVRGPSSALYGPNAVTGVINFITARTDENTPLVSGSLQTGSQSTFIGNVGIRKKLNEKFSIGVTSNYETRDRSTEDVYIFNDNMNLDGNPAGKGWYSLEEYQRLRDGVMGLPILDPNDDINELFEDVSKARERVGVNAYIGYNANVNTAFNLSAGFQESYVNSSSMGDNPTAFGGRKSSTAYTDISGRINKFNFQTNIMAGTQDFATGDEGFKQDMQQFNFSADYDLQLKALNIRPGVSYQYVSYSDEEHIPAGGSGYLNGKKELNTFSASLRFDYLAFQKLRLIAALRAEKYNTPDKWYASWQLAGTLPINETNLLRFVYSRANRSSFTVNAHSDYMWNREGRLPPAMVHFKGTEDHNLVTTDMFELGYRVKPAKSIMIDLEAFYSVSDNFGALMTNSTTVAYVPQVNPPVVPAFVQITYQNLDLKAKQLGASVNLDYVASKKLIVKAHATFQKTELTNYLPYSRDELVMFQAGDAATKLDPANGVMEATSNVQPANLEDIDHESTPSFWGSLGLIYRPIEKLELSSYGYYYGNQTFVNQYDEVDVDAKFIWNAQVSYKPISKVTLFVNAKNILNDKSNEFAFMDEMGSLYLGGVRFNF